MDMDIDWTQGKCTSDAFFITNTDICFISGSFIKFCSTGTFSEISFQGPVEKIECLAADSDVKVIAIVSKNIHILNHPKLDIVSQWSFKRKSSIIQMVFVGHSYLLTLEGMPDFKLTLWNWKEAVCLKHVIHSFPYEDPCACFMTVNPALQNAVVFQHCNGLYFYEIDDLTDSVDLIRKTLYLPTAEDNTCASALDDKAIEKLTYFDKIQHNSWGIHSDLLGKLQLNIVCAQLPEHELVEFYDILLKQKRLRTSCHCWLDGNRLIIACLNGTVLLVKLELSLKALHFSNCIENGSHVDKCITCMAFNKNGLYVGWKNGDIYLIQNIEEWDSMILLSSKECLSRMKFSPDYKSLLIANSSGTLALLSVSKHNTDVMYLSTCQDDSSIVGIYCIDTNFCLTAKTSGRIEIWDLCIRMPISQYHLKENIKCMEGCPSSSSILVSSCSGYVYIIDFSDTKNVRIVHILRPSEKSIKIIKCENFGRLAFFASEDQYIFICSILPSVGFSILGYVSIQHNIKDLAVFSKGPEDIICVAVLTGSKDETCVQKFAIPKAFLYNFSEYWEDSSGTLKTENIGMKTIHLGTNCYSVVAHLLNGFILYHLKLKKFINISYDDMKIPNLKSKDKFEEDVGSFDNCQLFLSPAHYMLLAFTNNYEIVIMKSHNFNIIYKQRLAKFSREKLCCSFTKRCILVEGFKGVLACLKLKKEQDMAEMSWTIYCRNKRIMEDEILATMKEIVKVELTAFITQMLNKVNKDSISGLSNRRNELEENFKYLGKQVEDMARENFSVPIEHQLDSEEFLVDESFKEKMLERRSVDLSKYDEVVKEKLATKERDINDIKKTCIDSFVEKGRILKSFKQNVPIHNYSILKLPNEEKLNINYVFKKRQLEKYLEKLKLKEIIDDSEFESKLLFDKDLENEIHLDFEKQIREQSFQLQNTEERIDYTLLLKYIIRVKRMAFNCKFKKLENFRQDTVQKINDNNQRIKKILDTLKEEREIWEPEIINYDNYFEVTRKEIEDARAMQFEDDVDEVIGLGNDFLKDDWLIKLKLSLKQKSQITVRKENADMLKKEIEKKRKSIDVIVDHYEELHEELAKDKLHCDLEINQYELQLYLLLFSVSNFSTYKKWETRQRNCMKEMGENITRQDRLIRQMETLLSKYEEDGEDMRLQSYSLDEEVKQISKSSRNKQAIVEAYNQRPIIIKDTESLNPHKEIAQNYSIEELNYWKNKPPKIPLQVWKQICTIREKKFTLEKEIKLKTDKMKEIHDHIDKLCEVRDSLKKEMNEREKEMEKVHETRMRCNFETPMVHPVPDLQLEIKYPDELNFREVIYLQNFHIEGLNAMINNEGKRKLEVVKEIAKAEYQIRKNNSKSRIGKLEIRDTKKEIELVKSIPLTKDIQKIIQDPKGFRLQDRIDTFDKSKQMEMDEIIKQKDHVESRILSIETKKDILKKSTNEKKKEIVKLEGDIAELRKIENLTMRK